MNKEWGPIWHYSWLPQACELTYHHIILYHIISYHHQWVLDLYEGPVLSNISEDTFNYWLAIYINFFKLISIKVICYWLCTLISWTLNMKVYIYYSVPILMQLYTFATMTFLFLSSDLYLSACTCLYSSVSYVASIFRNCYYKNLRCPVKKQV